MASNDPLTVFFYSRQDRKSELVGECFVQRLTNGELVLRPVNVGSHKPWRNPL